MKVWNLQDNGNGKCYVKCNPGSERQNHMFSLSCESQPLIIQYAYLDGGNYGLRPRNLKGTHKTENEALRKEAGERNGTQMTWKWVGVGRVMKGRDETRINQREGRTKTPWESLFLCKLIFIKLNLKFKGIYIYIHKNQIRVYFSL